MFWQYFLIGLIIAFWVAFAIMETYMQLHKDNEFITKKINKKKGKK